MNKSPIRKNEFLLNGSEDCASTITAAHSFAGNIVNPVGGHKQMGVLEYYEEDTERV